VPRALIVDGRDSFGTSWGGVSNGGGGGNVASVNYNAAACYGYAQAQYASSSLASPHHQHHQQQQQESNDNLQVPSWNGPVSMFHSSQHAILFGDQTPEDQPSSSTSMSQQHDQQEEDPLDRFRTAASVIGLNPLHSRFHAAAPYANHSYNSGNNSRHVQWDDDDEEEEEDDDDDYCYGQNAERLREAKRRQLEKMESQTREARRGWNSAMEDAWEETFYGGYDSSSGDRRENDIDQLQRNQLQSSKDTSDTTNNAHGNVKDDGRSSSSEMEREIQWHDYWMPPRPSPTKYQVPLPFDTAASPSNASSAWTTSFNMGYHPGSASSVGGIGGNDASSSAGITNSWRENVLSESLRKQLEGCDVVKGFNIFVDGGNYNSSNTTQLRAKVQQPFNVMMNAGGGFHAGLATSLLEELSEECRSAGRFVVMVDPFSSASNNNNDTANHPTNGRTGNHRELNHFRKCLNAGLAMHGLSSNSDAFLPVSIDGAYRALRGKRGTSGECEVSSPNRTLFEGSAALSLALEASTLFYRFHRHSSRTSSSSSSSSPRSRIGIQSGFYQGYSTNSGYDDDAPNEPYATAPSLTYHEFLACARPSSDRRRSILELDALLRPITYPSLSNANISTGGVGAMGALGALSGGGLSPSSAVLASLASAGLIGGNFNDPTSNMGELERRMIRGTSIERMNQQRQQSYRSSRGGSSRQTNEPGEWLEDMSTTHGLLSSLSGAAIPFGRRAVHHHFALSTSLRPAASDARSSSFDGSSSSGFLRPMMESMGVAYRPEVSLGSVVKDTVVDLTGVGSYWRSIFTDRRSQLTPAGTRSMSGQGSDGQISLQQQQKEQQQQSTISPKDLASHTPILSVLGNSTRSYPRLRSIASGFSDALSRPNMGYYSRDAMAGVVPERDDCTDALEYCQELMDVYEPPMGSGLVLDEGEDENDDLEAYFDEEAD